MRDNALPPALSWESVRRAAGGVVSACTPAAAWLLVSIATEHAEDARVLPASSPRARASAERGEGLPASEPVGAGVGDDATTSWPTECCEGEAACD